MKKIACIGNRNITKPVEDYLEAIGTALVDRGFLVASGNASGSDQAFMRGAAMLDSNMVTAYLPWLDYNKDALMKGVDTIVLNTLLHGYAYELVRQLHPAADRLKDSHMRLHARNVLILNDAAMCLAYQNNPGRGGTDFGLRLAYHYSIPVLNAAQKDGQKRIKNKLGIDFDAFVKGIHE